MGLFSMKGNSKGFTLAELLVAMAISGVVMTAVYITYRSQQNSYIAQEEVAALQQRFRAAMFYMTQQIQEAGCNPAGTPGGKPPGILTAESNKIEFTADLRGPNLGDPPDGKTESPYEHVTYSLYTSGGIQSLGVKSSENVTNQPVVQYVDALNFVYLDADGNVTADLNRIRSVQVTLVVRAERADMDYMNHNVYKNKQGEIVLPAQNDHYRRRGETVQILCRNLGLE